LYLSRFSQNICLFNLVYKYIHSYYQNTTSENRLYAEIFHDIASSLHIDNFVVGILFLAGGRTKVETSTDCKKVEHRENSNSEEKVASTHATTKCGVGHSENPNSREAGIEAATMALEKACLEKADLLLTYYTPKYDVAEFLSGLRSVVGSSTRIIGGGSVGIITNDYLAYDGFHAGVLAFSSDTCDIDMYVELGLADNEFLTGANLGRQIRSKSYQNEPNILIMYDSIKEERISLNLATPLVKGLKSTIGNWPSIAGVGMLGDLQFSIAKQIYDDELLIHSANALVLSGNVKMHTTILHGCKPVSDYHTITKTDANVVLEIDNKPATEAIAELLGPNSDKSWEEYPLFITLGVNHGDRFGEFNPKAYTNRLTMAVDQKRNGLIMFEDDLQAGMDFQLMGREVSNFDYIRETTQELFDGFENEKPLFAVYIDCAGRAAAYCGSSGEEAEELQKVLGKDLPLLGMYSGVEIALIEGEFRPLDWTGVLCIFTETP